MSDEAFVARLQHIRIEGKGVAALDAIEWSACLDLRALFASSNRIREIRGLEPLGETLVELHLASNAIEQISGLEACPRLQKLVLDFNRIAVVERLENCAHLKELHISR
jgi:Leucine-rich repeat (LRR) protein